MDEAINGVTHGSRISPIIRQAMAELIEENLSLISKFVGRAYGTKESRDIGRQAVGLNHHERRPVVDRL
jgi:hypothetical protein